MADDVRRYWRDPEEAGAPDRAPDAPRPAGTHPLQTPAHHTERRDFLKAAGFTLAGAAISSCSSAPTEQAIPLLVQPEGLIPGRTYYQTSTCGECSAACGVLIKTRDGRPIKLEGNPVHPLSKGGLCAVGQASVLGLYDSLRFTGPRHKGAPLTWKETDEAILRELAAARSGGAQVRVLTGTIVSPTLLDSVQQFVKTFPGGRHVQYDALPGSASLDAHALTHGVRAMPHVRLDRAEVIVGIDADFLGTWIAPVEFAAAYREGRVPDATPRRFSHHTQLESRMSLTGMKADRRVRVAPHEVPMLLAALATRLASRAGVTPAIDAPVLDAAHGRVADDLAERLWSVRGRAVVLCGVQDVPTQVLANYANDLLQAYGGVLDLERPSRQVQGSDGDLEQLMADLRAGSVSVLIVHGVNPVYQWRGGKELAGLLAKVPLLISLSDRDDETTRIAQYSCPDSHALEAWGDAEPVAGTFSIQQPGVHPIGKTRPAVETFSAWSGGDAKSADELVRDFWEARVFPRQKTVAAFADFWAQALQDGTVSVEADPVRPRPFNAGAVKAVATTPPAADRFALVLYPKIGLLDGRHAFNAWLQELPDPVSKVTWDNYACLSMATAKRLGILAGDVVRLEADGGPALELPAYVQPGQDDRVVAVALGYGSVLSARFRDVGPKWLQARPAVGKDGLVGVNAAPLRDRAVRVTKTGATQPLASTQAHFRMSAPEHLRGATDDLPSPIHETTLAALVHKAPTPPAEHAPADHAAADHRDLWPADHVYTGRKWAMSIDLTSCTGCSACIIGCQAENNTPVVGKDEVMRSREMHWLRLDRYYTGADDAVDVAVQPMLCQHCENAPCETVCPVEATVHNSEGLNVQVYNRCIGTKFCENNCPYKVRRFNWFAYSRPDPLQNLVLNPDVTVRSRGVMEKCTFCVQRIQESEIEATRRGEPLADGTVQTACQQSCPTQAIVFGDINDPASQVSMLAASGRGYKVLDELNIKPSVTYRDVVRNREDA